MLLIFLLLLPTVLSNHPPPRYRIQLDAPASSRWNQVVDDHLQYLPLVQKEAAKIIPRPVQKIVWKIAENIRYFFPLDYARELEGIATRSGLPLGEVVGLNILYDITAFDRKHVLHQGCTSIVACDDKGRIWHGRNLDYEMGDLLKNTTVIVDFYRGEKLIYTGTTFVLYVGLLTGQRPGGFTVSLNARYSGPYIMNILMEIITKFRNPVSFVIREASPIKFIRGRREEGTDKTLEEEESFSAAVNRLSTTHLICPAYIIVGGMDKFEGVVISRDRWSAADVQRLSEENWYFVETNFDHWKEDGDKRRITASRLLSKMGRNRLNALSLRRVLSTSPVTNNLTIYSGVLSAANPSIIYESTVVIDN